MAAVSANPLHSNAPFEVWNDRAIVMEAVRKDGKVLEFVSPGLQADTGVVRAAVKQNGWALKYASEELKADWEVALDAVEQSNVAFIYVDADLRENTQWVISAVTRGGRYVMGHVSDGVRKKRAVQKAAALVGSLQYARSALKEKKKYVMAAVNANGNALEFASLELRSDPEVVLTAIENWSKLDLEPDDEDDWMYHAGLSAAQREQEKGLILSLTPLLRSNRRWCWPR